MTIAFEFKVYDWLNQEMNKQYVWWWLLFCVNVSKIVIYLLFVQYKRFYSEQFILCLFFIWYVLLFFGKSFRPVLCMFSVYKCSYHHINLSDDCCASVHLQRSIYHTKYRTTLFSWSVFRILHLVLFTIVLTFYEHDVVGKLEILDS